MNVTDSESVFSFRFLPESARWLMTRGKKEEVQKELLRAARVNRRKIPQNLLDKVCSIIADRPERFVLFECPLLLILLWFCWGIQMRPISQRFCEQIVCSFKSHKVDQQSLACVRILVQIGIICGSTYTVSTMAPVQVAATWFATNKSSEGSN